MITSRSASVTQFAALDRALQNRAQHGPPLHQQALLKGLGQLGVRLRFGEQSGNRGPGQLGFEEGADMGEIVAQIGLNRARVRQRDLAGD